MSSSMFSFYIYIYILLRGYFHIKSHITPRKAVSTRGRRPSVDTFFSRDDMGLDMKVSVTEKLEFHR